jgi:hypothetical protein
MNSHSHEKDGKLCKKIVQCNRPLITINVPVVFMARYVLILRGATSL